MKANIYAALVVLGLAACGHVARRAEVVVELDDALAGFCMPEETESECLEALRIATEE